MTEVWTRWEGQLVNGVFPLRRFLRGSEHSAVFLTDHQGHGPDAAVIKLITAPEALAGRQLAYWKTAAALSHPHLTRLLDCGRCQLGERQFLFVVMEYAQETLAEILPQRPLTAQEARAMLLPTLGALEFLHRQNLVQGHLTPANVLVVNDRLTLASDTIRPAGEPRAVSAESQSGDPPEAKHGALSGAGDIWALGITFVQAITQREPLFHEGRLELRSLPADLPPAFVKIIKRCLSADPASRPTAADLETMLAGRSPASERPAQPVTAEAVAAASVAAATERHVAHVDRSRRHRSAVPLILALVIVLLGAWAGLRLLRLRASPPAMIGSASRPASREPAAPAAVSENPPGAAAAIVPSPTAADVKPAPAASTSVAAPVTPQQLSTTSPVSSPSVVREEIPNVPRSARDTIRGHIKVLIRVSVDSAGAVADQTIELAGPSKYFLRLASEAADKWKFVPADNDSTRHWLLQFDFSRAGTTASATAPKS
ncbi:MAG TPA: protein kinase [Steroidobacteraceae bacterium]